VIYPDVSLEEWLRRYPDLKPKTGLCDACGGPKPTVKPFRYRHGVGIQSEPCKCGKGRHSTSVMLVTDEKHIQMWTEILNKF